MKNILSGKITEFLPIFSLESGTVRNATSLGHEALKIPPSKEAEQQDNTT